MDRENQYKEMLLAINNNIQHYREMIKITSDPFQKLHYENLLYNAVEQFNHWQRYYSKGSDNSASETMERFAPNQKEFTLEELAKYNGSNGKPAYVAVNGVVYDVSTQPAWGGGTHFGLYSGKDLTDQFKGCHSGDVDILKNLPQVGVLKV